MGICTMLVVLTSIVWYLKFQKASDEDKDMKPCNAIYYWKTQFQRSEEHTSELQSHYSISYAVFCLKKKK